MEEARWERLAAATGLGFAALVLAAVLIAPAPPKSSDSTTRIIQFAANHRSGILGGGYLSGLAAVLGLWFVGTVRSYLRRVEGGTGRLSGIAFGGGVLSGAFALAAAAVSNSVALHSAQPGNDQVVRALFDLGNSLMGMILFPSAVLVAAVSILAKRTRVFPAWYAWAGAAIAVLFLVAGTSIYVDSGPLQPGGPVLVVALASFLVWVVATSLLMLRRRPVPVPAAAPAGP